jgi:putative transposase
MSAADIDDDAGVFPGLDEALAFGGGVELENEVVEIAKIKETQITRFCACSLGLIWQSLRMPRRRWIVPWADSETKPAIYHCIARVVDRRFAFLADDKEQFRIYMRMMENFSGCRVLAYCIMCNHFHILLEVPPRPKVPLADEELLKRLGALYSKAFVATVAKELKDAREVVAQGMAADGEAYVQRIHERFTYRMHDLSEFMKTLLQRFTRWHNIRTKRRGNLWEETFKSVVVENGLASKTMAAYIDLNPVRAGMVSDPAEYRWSSYGEAMGATGRVKGDSLTRSGAKAKAGLVRAIMADKGWEADARHWAGRVSREYRMILLEEGEEKTREVVNARGEREVQVVKKGMKTQQVVSEMDRLSAGKDVALRKMLRWKIRYFTDSGVVGSRAFVERMFQQSRDRFGPKRKSGARKMRGKAAGAADLLWTERDLRVGVE